MYPHSVLLSLAALSCSVAQDTFVLGRVTSVAASKESIAYDTVTLSLTNPTPADCELTRYSLIWPSGRKEVAVALTLSPGTTERLVRVDFADGNLESLTAASARVRVFARCAANPLLVLSKAGR